MKMTLYVGGGRDWRKRSSPGTLPRLASLSSFSLVQLYTKAIILHSTLTMTTRDVSERRLTLTLVNVKTKAHGADLAS